MVQNRKQRRALASAKRRGLTKGISLVNRTEDNIKSDYATACAQAGELQYHINQMQVGLKQLNERIEALNKEATALKASQPEAPSVQEQSEATPVAG